jgi:predicted 2-oxoglutarate/Fe(II)-dependent dioxygenase YbiX/peroxiredoxin
MTDLLDRRSSPGPDPETPPPAKGRSGLFIDLQPGDRFPWLVQDVISRKDFFLDTLAGRYQLYGFFLTTKDEGGRKAVDTVLANRPLFDEQHCSFLGVSVDPDDVSRDLKDLLPGIRFICDYDLKVSKACGAAGVEAVYGDGKPLRRFWMLVDPSLHVLRIFAFDDPQAVIDAVKALPPPDQFGGLSRPAPILLLPNVLEPQMCRHLINLYDQNGGGESGVHRDGRTVMDRSFKSRSDFTIEDKGLLQQLQRRIYRRVMPEIEKLFFGKMTHIERFIVGCYSAETGGHFAPHRDNREGLTAHRRYALSVNLNDDFKGGEVVFPEYNNIGYKAPAGWAVVFPCAILHRVKAVTAGARYAFLPFLYDDSGAVLRETQLERVRKAAS